MNECGGHLYGVERDEALSVPRKSLSGTNFTIAIHCVIWAAVWAGAMAGAGSSVGMEESVIAIGNSARPPRQSSRDSRLGPQKLNARWTKRRHRTVGTGEAMSSARERQFAAAMAAA